jgi:hypothetical protein
VEQFGEGNLERAKRLYGKIDDICDVTNMTVAMQKNYDELIGPKFYSGHVEKIGLPSGRQKESDRWRELPKKTIDSSSATLLDPVYLRREYLSKNVEKKNDRLQKTTES